MADARLTPNLHGAVEDFLAAYRAKYRNTGKSGMRSNAPMLAEVTALNAAFRAPPSAPVAAPAEPEYGSTDLGYQIMDPRVTDGAKRLMKLVTDLFGNDSPAFADLEALVDRAPQPPRPGTAPLSDEQRQDLLAAAFFIAGRKEPGAMLKDEDADRIADLLTELSGFDLDSIGHPTTPTPKD